MKRRKSYGDFRSLCLIFPARLAAAPWWWWKARSSDLCLTETTAMIIFGPLLVIAGIGFFCWLLFTLAVFALPFYAGLTIGAWAFHTGAGWLGGAVVGVIAAGVTFGVGQLALAFVPWTWLRLAIVLVYAAPATIAGYYATHGNCPDGHAVDDMADDFFARRRVRCRRHRFDPHHCSDPAGTGRNASRADLTLLQLLLSAHVDLHLSEFIVVTRRQ